LTAPLRKVWNAPGDTGNRDTAANMAAMARSRRSDPAVSAAWVDIAGQVVPPTTYDEGMMLRSWLAQHFQFQRDPTGTGVFGGTEELELLQDPLLMLQQITQSYVARGDCDDAAILGAALALGAPVPFSGVRFALVGLDANQPYEHVYAEILTSRGWLDLDVTRRAGYVPVIRKREVVYV
jgi:transglutaminase-like putative cysteine protease